MFTMKHYAVGVSALIFVGVIIVILSFNQTTLTDTLFWYHGLQVEIDEFATSTRHRLHSYAKLAPYTSTGRLNSGFENLLRKSQPRLSRKKSQDAVISLISRLLPHRVGEFIVEINSELGPKDKDTFKLETQTNGKLLITGSTGVAASLGFNYYLKNYGHSQISWSGKQVDLLEKPLPRLNQSVTLSTNDRFFYYDNVCTFGYTYVWWNFTRWQQEIDWMALNGINLPLAFVGQEAITQRVFHRLGVSDIELADWFTGPAFLPWFRMGNLVKWAGPLSQEFINSQVDLQHKILDSMRAFGMSPVLPAFAGHVPPAIKRLYPDASITKLDAWGHFTENYTGTYYLNPTDDLYAKISSLYIKEYIKEFGTDHFYNVDPWNEMLPASNSTDYLKMAGQSIISALKQTDPEAVWILQGWMFTYDSKFWTTDRAGAFLSGISKGDVIILDLAAEYRPVYTLLNSFFGHAFIWCMLNNYGGRMGLYGHMHSVNQNVTLARNSSNMIGTGLTMESTGTNYILYELMNEMHYRNMPVNLSSWIHDYAHRRYGLDGLSLDLVWSNLIDTAYNSFGLGQQLIIERPSWAPNNKSFPMYDTDKLKISIKYLNDALVKIPSEKASQLLRHDVVDLWREMLYVIFCETFRASRRAYNQSDIQAFNSTSLSMLDILDDLDSLMLSHSSYLLGIWVSSAVELANTPDDETLFRFNALNQLTLWGPTGEIKDYAGKQWADLISLYYKPRWKLFLNYSYLSLKEGIPFPLSSYTSDILANIEQPFSCQNSTFHAETVGDTLSLALKFYNKYIGTSLKKLI